jgi:hypothetical protein
VCSGQCEGYVPSLRVQTRPKPLDFSGVKIIRIPSFGGEVKHLSHVPALRHVKEPSNLRELLIAS